MGRKGAAPGVVSLVVATMSADAIAAEVLGGCGGFGEFHY